MNPQKLSAALKLSLEAALKSQETGLFEAVGILEMEKQLLLNMVTRPQPQEVKIHSPLTINGKPLRMGGIGGE